MSVPRRGILVMALVGLSAWLVYGYAHRTARGLYNDCAVGETGGAGASTERYQRCADYIDRIFNDWNLNQANGICSRHFGSELPRAYVEYRRARGMGFLSGRLTSAAASVKEFLDSQKQPCQVPDPKTNPP